jgi:hypothetical protein
MFAKITDTRKQIQATAIVLTGCSCSTKAAPVKKQLERKKA